ncbi:MAG TPA: glycosyltransferase family 39 protein [Candidatus Binataceae bacterium]|nr:glycosyltransferase family 39 protein [Candidatus Binataceae bacterium]
MPVPKRKEGRERIITPAARVRPASRLGLATSDAAWLALFLCFALLLLYRTGFANGQELWPMPDAVDYAAMAVNLDRGLGPVIHFAGITYPPLNTIGYPVMLAAGYPFVGHQPEWLCLITALTALIAIAGLYLLTRWAFDRPTAVVAATLLTMSPYFLGLSTCVLSDVPSLAVIIVAVLAFLYGEEKGSVAASATCGLLVGWAITVRITNITILAGMAAAIIFVGSRRLRFSRVMAFALAFIPFPVLQALANLYSLGSPFANGYAFWRPDLHGWGGVAFAMRYPVERAYTTAAHGNAISYGNLISYALALLGLDGLFGQLNLGFELRPLLHAHYSLYPFPMAIFAGLGFYFALCEKRDAITLRAIYLGVTFLAALLLIYLFYFYLDPRFLLPGSFIVFAIAAYGVVTANRKFTFGWTRFGVIALDVLLAGAIVMETVSRLATPSPDSNLVAEVHELRPKMANAVVVTDVSLQWLDLFAGDEGIEFVGLDSLFAEEALNEYHLHFLYEKRATGHPWPMPPILLPEGKLDPAEARQLAADARQGRPVYLLVAMPMRVDWASTLMGEFGELDRDFSLETIQRYPEIALYRMQPN